MRAAFNTISPFTPILHSGHFPCGSPTKVADEHIVSSKRGHGEFSAKRLDLSRASPDRLC